ncbi:MAG: transcriptional regulator [Okeania sp. SIO2H7]|nr:transcriptional regulator [Okeania sp. SIO2H7]
MPNSLPYHPSLIARLKTPEYAADFIDAFFEEKDPETELLKLVLSDVAEALAEEKMTSERAKIHREKLDKILSQKGSDAIYNFAGWLKELGLKLTVTTDEILEDETAEVENLKEVSIS